MDSDTALIPTTGKPARGRGWVPALVASLLTAAGLWALQLLSDVAPLAGLRDDYRNDTGDVWTSLLGGKLTFFGSDTGALFGGGDDIVRVVAMTAAVFVVAYVVTWLGTVGVRPRAVLPLFWVAWLGAVLGGAAGIVAGYVAEYVSSGGEDSFLSRLGALIDYGDAYGLTYGWIPALVAALFWAAAPGKQPKGARDEHEVDDATAGDDAPTQRSLLDDLSGTE